MRIAAFLSHPIQHFTPLWAALSTRDNVTLKVFYYSRCGVEATRDKDFGVDLKWDVDLLAGHESEFLPRRWPTRDPLDYSWRGLNKGIGKVLDRGWDAVYVAGYAHLNNWAVARGCKKRGIPLLVHSDVSAITAKLKSPLKRAAKRVVVGRFLKMVSGALAIGNHSKDYFAYMGMDPARIHFVPIPVDVDRFRKRADAATEQEKAEIRRRLGIPADKKLVVFCGKLIPRKRPQDIPAAIAKLDRDDVMALIIGEGILRPEIEANFSRHAVVTGFVNQDEIPVLLSMAVIGVMPSSYDAHPLAVTESLCLGQPVLLSDRCGCYGPDDVLRDGEDGFVYPCGDTDAIAEKLRLLLDDQQMLGRMSARAEELADTQSPSAAASWLVKAVEAVCD